MKNSSLKSIVVLTLICIVVSALLAVTNFFTAPIIAEADRGAANAALMEVIPGAIDFEELTGETVPDVVTAVYRETSGKGYAIQLAAIGYGGVSSPISAVVGIDTEGLIIGVKVISYSGETPGKGDVIVNESFLSQFVGKNSNLTDVNIIAGSTYSTAGLINAVREAFAAYTTYSGVGPAEKSLDDLIIEQVSALIPGAKTFGENVELAEATENVRNIFVASPAHGSAVVYNFGDEENPEVAIVAVDVFGTAVACVDPEGNDVSATYADAMASAAALIGEVASSTSTVNAEAIAAMAGEGATVTPSAPVTSMTYASSVVNAYDITLADGTVQYGYVTLTYGNEGTVKIGCILDSDGAIVKYKTISSNEYQEHYEYYGGVILTANYAAKFTGLTSETYTSSVSAIARSTNTSRAVNTALEDIFAVHEAGEGSRK